MLTKIVLHGDLEDFGKEWDLDIHSPAEAVAAIEANSPGFLARLQSGEYTALTTLDEEGVAEEERVVVITDETLGLPISNKQVLHFVPIEDGDAFSAAYAVYFYVGSSAWGSVALAAVAAAITFAAITFALITVANMLMPSPPGIDDKKTDPSYAFSGPVNTANQGGVVPVLYGGPLLVGSQVIGHSILNEDLSSPGGDTTKLKSSAFAEIVDAVSEGEIAGFAGADLESSIYLDGVPARVNGEDQFEGFEVAYLKGTQDQDAEDLNLAVNPGANSVHTVSVLVKHDLGPLTKITEDPNVGSITMTVHFPALFKTRRSSDSVRPQKVQFAFNIKGTGVSQYVQVASHEVDGKAKDGFYKDYTFPILDSYGTAPFLIQMERLKEDSDDDSVHDELYWSTWTENVKSNLSYPNTAYAVTKFSSEFFSSLPVRGYLMKGLKVRVPNNYNPITRTYNGDWFGEFSTTLQWTNNPAWIYYDLATHSRYGLGQYLPDGLVGKWALYSISKYCDVLVDDGYNGQEPRFVCNLYLQNGGEALNVLRDLASSFRSIMFWSDGELEVHQDSPGPTQAQFTPSNVIGGDFTYSGTPKNLRTTVALVTWSNPDDNYNAWVEYVEDEAGIQLYGINKTSITAVGCTSRGQAHRTGKYALLMNLRLTDSATFKTGLDATRSVPGHVVKIVDPIHNQSDESVGGRVASVTDLSNVVLDRPVVLDPSSSYHLTVTMPDMVQSAHAVSNGSGTVTPPAAIALGTALPDTPVAGAVWTLTMDTQTERLYRLLSVVDEETADGGYYKLSGVRYLESALLDADDPGKLEPPDIPGQGDGITAPSSLRLEEGIDTVDGNLIRFLDCIWGAPAAGDVHHYLITIKHEHGTDIVEEVTDTYYHLNNIQAGDYSVSVRAVNPLGQMSTAITAFITINELAPIDLLSITGLELFGQGNDTEFTGPSAEFAWRLTSLLAGDLGDETFGGDTGIPDPWFMDYEITISDENGVELRLDHTTTRSYTYTLDKNKEDGGPRRTFEIGVVARDIYNRKTEASYLEVYNPPPVGYTGVAFSYGIELIEASFTPPADKDFLRTRLHLSELKDFTPSDTTLAYEGDDTVVTISGLTASQYYVRLEGVDAFGPAGIYSQEYPVVIQTVSRIHDQLAGEILAGWLHPDLEARIDKIDTPTTGLTYLVTDLTESVGTNSADIETLQNSGFTGLQTFYQDGDPQLDDPAPTLNIGDLWIDTDNGDLISRWNGTSWDPLSTSGATVYYGDGPPDNPFTGDSPASPAIGDYYIDYHDYGDGNGPANTPYLFTTIGWVDVSQGLLTATASEVSVISGQVNDPTTNNSALFIAINAVDGRVDVANGLISGNLSSIETLDLIVTDANTGNVALGQKIDATDITVTQHGLDIAANLVDIEYFRVEIDTPDSGESVMAQYLQELKFDVNDTGGVVDVNAEIVTTLSATVDRKAATFYQNDDPVDNVPAPTLVDGDIWIDTDDNNHMFVYHAATTSWKDGRDSSVTGATTWIGNGLPDETDAKYTNGDIYYEADNNYKPYRFNSTVPEWVSVQDTASTGVTTWVAAGAPVVDAKYSSGDLYFDSSNNYRPYRYNAVPAWVDITGTTGIQSYYQNDKPTGGSYIAGDLWFETDQNNQVHRHNGTDFILIRDTQIADAIQDAADARDVADGKIVTFYQDGPTAPTGVAIGDLWVDTADGNSLSRYNGTDWDTVQDESIADALAAAVVAQDTADGKVVTFYEATEPTGQTIGDLWVDTDDNSLSRYNGATWDPVQDTFIQTAWNLADQANTTADGKIISFFQSLEPSGEGESEGDFWVDTDDNSLHRYTSGVWEDAQDAGIEASLTAANAARDIADGKIVSFFEGPTPAGSPGDMWFNTSENNRPYRYDATNGWESVQDGNASGVTSFFDANEPSGGAEGDLWFESDENNRPYRHDGTDWILIQDTFVPGLDTFYQTLPPTSGMTIGDLWFDTDDGNKVYRFTGSVGLWQEVINGEFSGVIPYVQANMPFGGTYYIGDLWIDIDEGNTPHEWNGGSWVNLINTPPTVTTTAAVAIEQHARIEQDGLAFAEYTMKVDVNGHIAGIGLGVSGGQSGPIRSSIVMLADTLSIGFPTTEYQENYRYALGDWVTPTQAWIDQYGDDYQHPDGEWVKVWTWVYKVTFVDFDTPGNEPNWPTVVGTSTYNGARFECRDKHDLLPFIVGNYNVGTQESPVSAEGVIISNAYIGVATIDRAHIIDAAIDSAKIKDLAVTTAKIADLAVQDAHIDSLFVGKLTGDTYEFNVSETLSGVVTDGYATNYEWVGPYDIYETIAYSAEFDRNITIGPLTFITDFDKYNSNDLVNTTYNIDWEIRWTHGGGAQGIADSGYITLGPYTSTNHVGINFSKSVFINNFTLLAGLTYWFSLSVRVRQSNATSQPMIGSLRSIVERVRVETVKSNQAYLLFWVQRGL